MKFFTMLYEKTTDYFAIAAGIILIFIMLSVCYSVATRYIWGFTTSGLFEFWEYSMLWIPFLGSSWLLKKNGFVSVDILTDRLNPRPRAILKASLSILCTFICLVLTIFGTHAVWVSFRDGIRMLDDLYLPQGLIIMIIPIGSFLLLIGFIRQTCQFIKKLNTAPAQRPG